MWKKILPFILQIRIICLFLTNLFILFPTLDNKMNKIINYMLTILAWLL